MRKFAELFKQAPRRWSIMIACWVLIAISWVAIGIHWVPKIFGECGWFTPKMVEFHQGMTLCPGQSAHLEIVVPLTIPKNEKDGI